MNQTNHEVKTFLDTVNSELDKFQKQIDYHSLERARDLILKAEKKYNRIHVTGIGKPGMLQDILHHYFLQLELQHIRSMVLKPSMVVQVKYAQEM